MKIQENITLAEYTTFKIGGKARFFCIVSDEDELVESVRFARDGKMPIFILGGGSNLLIADTGFAGLVIKIEMKGIRIINPTSEISGKSEARNQRSKEVMVFAAAGEQWDDFVEWSVSRGLGGLENLSAIPGTVGAVPVQNIGAYGAEASHSVVSVRVFDTLKMAFVELSNRQCGFAYRDSMFKHKKGRYVVTGVKFRLAVGGIPNTEYKELAGYLGSRNISNPTIEEVRKAVIDIRWNKLPDWKLWGTAGSFFKNPIISKRQYSRLKKMYPDMPSYPESLLRVKVPLGWILDKICNVKGLSLGGVRVYEKQALVLVSQPGATSEEVVTLSRELMRRVKEKTGIDIEGEVEWVN